MIKRLIFDVDQTLIAGASFEKAQQEALTEYGKYTDDNYLKLNKALDEYELYYDKYTKKDYLDFLSQNVGEVFDERFLKIFFEKLREYSTPTQDIRLTKVIENLSKKYELVLLSNYFEESQRNRLNKLGINDFFTEYYGEKICKPNKIAFLSAIGNHNPKECVMIGDNIELDIKGALNNNINTIWINPNNKKADVNTREVKQVSDITLDLIESIERDDEILER